MTGTRLDKWLWAARFYKTRGLSTEEIERGRVSLNGQPAKPSREVRVGDRIELRQGWMARTVIVKDTSAQRGPAPVAQTLYEETAESVAQREQQLAERRLAAEPADAYAQGRPTKRDRRRLADWNRWSVSIDAK
jgi:ribosome-associated heat shock protein Hsp15